MDCEQALAELEAYLDGELRMADRHAVEDHLQTCSDCFERTGFRIRLRAVIRRKCRPAVLMPPGLADRIRTVIEQD